MLTNITAISVGCSPCVSTLCSEATRPVIQRSVGRRPTKSNIDKKVISHCLNYLALLESIQTDFYCYIFQKGFRGQKNAPTRLRIMLIHLYTEMMFWVQWKHHSMYYPTQYLLALRFDNVLPPHQFEHSYFHQS